MRIIHYLYVLLPSVCCDVYCLTGDLAHCLRGDEGLVAHLHYIREPKVWLYLAKMNSEAFDIRLLIHVTHPSQIFGL